MIENILRLVAVGSLLIGVTAIYITIRSNTRQVGAQIFLAYSDRICAIRRSITLDSSEPDAAATAMYLIFEFYELKRRGYVSGAIWSIWDADMADLLLVGLSRNRPLRRGHQSTGR